MSFGARLGSLYFLIYLLSISAIQAESAPLLSSLKHSWNRTKNCVQDYSNDVCDNWKTRLRAEVTVIESAPLKEINPHRYSGSPVYFINGMLTSQETATSQCENLSHQLQRPCVLLYNDTEGAFSDFCESIYDRTWKCTSFLIAKQTDKTTRQVIAFLMNYMDRADEPSPLSLVCHSQGCLKLSNALDVLSYLDYGDKMARAFSIVATGAPLRTFAKSLKTRKLQYLTNSDDPLARMLQLKTFRPVDFRETRHLHGFQEAYVRQIETSMLDP